MRRRGSPSDSSGASRRRHSCDICHRQVVRFGEPGGSQQAPRSQTAPQNNRGWTGFGNPGSSSSAPRQQYSQPQPGYRGNSGSSAPQSLRIAPPVVQQRSGGGSYSAPRSYSGGSSASRPSGGGAASHSSGGGGSSRGGSRRQEF